jgi:hypothetical protein
MLEAQALENRAAGGQCIDQEITGTQLDGICRSCRDDRAVEAAPPK